MYTQNTQSAHLTWDRLFLPKFHQPSAGDCVLLHCRLSCLRALVKVTEGGVGVRSRRVRSRRVRSYSTGLCTVCERSSHSANSLWISRLFG